MSITERLQQYAYGIYEARCGGNRRICTDQERNEDWRLAETMLASDTLNGTVDFIHDFSPDTFHYLEKQWLDDVKQMRAYFLWEKRKGRVDPRRQEHDYLYVCNTIRSKLINSQRANPDEFVKVKEYIKKKYLIDNKTNVEKEGTKRSIIEKARRIGKINSLSERKDAWEDWLEAERYVTIFYNNVIPAVEQDDAESISNILKIMQLNDAFRHGYRIINCFEAGIVLNFIKKETVEHLLNSARGEKIFPRPPSIYVSQMEEAHWPADFKVPESCKYLFSEHGHTASKKRILRFSGKMTLQQMNDLCAALSRYESAKEIVNIFIKGEIIKNEVL